MKGTLLNPVCRGPRNKGVMLMAFIAMALITGTLMFPKNTEACCFYNHTETKIHVTFSCGVFCWNDWDIEPGDHACRPGKGGNATSISKSKHGYHACNYIWVKKHGWIEVHHVSAQGINKGVVENKDENGNTIETCTFDW
ncbi:MAG: hypothetical protein HPY65_04525 [Syntrophaceae bacterium]|nr:hypothetical protein [Syntrophaceae bacterium]